MKKILATMLLGALPALSSITFAQEMTEQASNRLEARLNPVIAVDASGQARLDVAAGVTNDRFTAEVEIAKDDFGPLSITPGNGFRDEVVELRILRGGTVIFSHVLQFSRNLVNDITFETDIRGAAAPELQAGDVARVNVNGHFTLRGRFGSFGPLLSVRVAGGRPSQRRPASIVAFTVFYSGLQTMALQA